MKNLSTFLTAFFLAFGAPAQDTFSIAAVDSLTGEVGSAGASCLDNIVFPNSGGAIIISTVLPGRGVIHTQAQWSAGNQFVARNKMLEGLSPTEIVAWMQTHDANFNPSIRQYGIADFSPTGSPRAAGFTGANCLDWKGHKTGPNYAIQGNILLGPAILDSIEARFLAATGSLADRLMAALQGANVVGADTRCADNGTSSLSAFLRVAKPTDAANSLYLSLNVPSLPAGQEPIDSLQSLYNQWKATIPTAEPTAMQVRISPNPAFEHIEVVLQNAAGAQLKIFDLNGLIVFSQDIHSGQNRLSPTLPNGVYFVRIQTLEGHSWAQRLIWQKP
jgi:uncharacterized Ntn-hydrolase superfamily protein